VARADFLIDEMNTQTSSRVIQGMLGEALGHHQAGRLREAERIYRQVLAIDAQHADSMHLLGMIAYHGGRHETAVEIIRNAIAINRKEASYHCNLGTVLQAQDQLDEAEACYRRALYLKPDWAEVHSNLGNILQSQGKLDEAVACQEHALALKPDFAEAHNNLGNALQAQGKLQEAATSYERALALKPNYATAHNNLGNVLVRQDRIDEAVAHCERALALKPDYADAHDNLGNALQAQGKLEEAATSYERALALKPDNASTHNNLGNVLVRQDRIDEAVAHYERALVLQPDYADAHNNLGVILKQQGNFNDAMAHYGLAIASMPDHAKAHFNRAEVKGFHPGDADLAALEALADRDDLSTDNALHIHFALAKALEDCGDYVRAFEHLRKGNALKRRQINYDEIAVLKFFERVSNVFDSSLFDHFRGEGDPTSVPVFVLGMPRSGSTLIEQILAGHPQIHGAGELTIFEKMEASGVFDASGQLLPYPECVPALDGVTLRRLGESYLAHLPAHAKGKLRIIDKLPGNFLRIGLIRLILPNARIIHTMRDPVDTCVSCYSKLFSDGLHYCYDLAELGRYYRGYSELMTHWRSTLPPGAMLDVSYEDVVDDLEGQARRLIDYCGLRWDDRCVSFHETSRPVKTASAVQVRKPLFRTSIQRWRNYEASLTPLLDELGKITGDARDQAWGTKDADGSK
jgi:tetratricopeptide (TPR) repeat protein